jgi:hypothetical protein
MEYRQDPPDSVIDEIASLLATGYLRLRNARTLQGGSGVTPPPELHPDAGDGLDSAPELSPHGAVS